MIFSLHHFTDRVFEPHTVTQEVYEVAGRPVVKAAMDGVNGMSNFHSRLYVYKFIYLLFPCA